jgi:hypothetical protein
MAREAFVENPILFSRRLYSPSQSQHRLKERLTYTPHLRRAFDQVSPQSGLFPQETCARLVSYGAMQLTMIKIVLIAAISKPPLSQ